VTLTFHPADGSAAQTIQRTYPANGGVRASIRTIFGFGDEFRYGWVEVSAPRGAVGFASNADIDRGGSTVTAAMTRPQSESIFGYLTASPIWSTGLTFVNGGQATVNVEIFAMAPSGRLIAGAENISSARFQIAPNGKVSRQLSEWIPTIASLGSAGGFVFVRSSQPIFGFGILFTQDNRIFSTLPAFDLPPAMYDPLATGTQP
jgi:hypothetical protein